MIQPIIDRPPYFKPKGFLDHLCPIPRKGIPKEADSRYNKKVIGTSVHQRFWEEELYKIKNGIHVKGLGHIPGRFYYYMNYKQMSSIMGIITPDMIDLHLEFARLVDYCKEHKHNLLCPKGRRKGVSEFAEFAVADYGARFNYGYKVGVAAGNKTYVDDFMAKIRYGDSNLPPELRLKRLTDNDNEIVYGYKIKNDQGDFVEGGTMSTIYARTMHTNPNMFKGLYLNDVISEEIGEHERWFEFFSATVDCLKNGSVQEGMFLAFGTGGNVDKGSKDFKRISYEAEKFNFIEFVIPATRMIYYGGATEPKRKLPLETELFKKHKAYELIGVEDLVLAEKHLKTEREALLKSGNLKAYNEHLQNNPLNKAEIFRKSVVNNFNTAKLNDQQARIDSEPRKFSKYKLDFVKNDKGEIRIPREVILSPAKKFDEDEECFLIIDTELYRRGHRNLYVAAIDSYDQDTSKTSKSLGAMEVLIRENSIGGAFKKSPVAVIRTRPKRKEKFYEMCLKLAIYYKLDGQVLVDVRNPGVIQYFKEMGCERYLAHRPAKFESPNSEQGHDFGVSLNIYSKPMMVSLMQSHIEDYVENIWFPELLNELGNYDEVEIGSDNDLADAHGMCLMQDVSCDVRPRNLDDDLGNDRFKFSFEKEGEFDFERGNVRRETDEQDFGLFY